MATKKHLKVKKAKPFTDLDWDGLAGAERFSNGDEPMIREMGEWAMAVADSCGAEYHAYSEDLEEERIYVCRRPFKTQALAAAFLDALPEDESLLEAFGFEPY